MAYWLFGRLRLSLDFFCLIVSDFIDDTDYFILMHLYFLKDFDTESCFLSSEPRWRLGRQQHSQPHDHQKVKGQD